jgi:hypothetical protein
MTLYTDILGDHSDEPGIQQSQLGDAVSVWAWMQSGATPQTVATAALTFNTTPALIRFAIDGHPWCFWSGPDDNPALQLIEHDGE